MDNDSSNEPSLASIFQYMKNMADDSKKTNNLVEKLSERLNTLENSGSCSDTNLKRSSRGSKGGPYKRSKISTGNFEKPHMVENAEQPVPIASGPIIQPVFSTDASAVQPDPFLSGPIAMPSENAIDQNNLIVIDSVISDDTSNIELDGDTIQLDELEQIYLSKENSHPPASYAAPLPQDTNNLVITSDQPLENNIPIICSKEGSNWNLSDDTLKWYKTVADLNLDDEQIRDIEEQFVPSDDCSTDFIPPTIPIVFCNKLKNNSSELYKQRSVYKAQKISTLAIKPLLSVLDNLDRNDPNLAHIATSIQLICTANLQLSRLRRASTAKYMRYDVKDSLFANPISHRHLFGQDFATAADQALKNQNSSQKVIFTPKQQSRPAQFSGPLNQLSITSPTAVPGPSSSSGPGPSSLNTRQPTKDIQQPFRQQKSRFSNKRRTAYYRRK